MLSTSNRNDSSIIDQKSSKPKVSLPRFGVAIFDDSRESGWAALPNGEPVRFRSPNDLKSDCIWICSASGSDFFAWSKLHHMRPSDYASKLALIGADFGLKVGAMGRFGGLAQKACGILAPTMHRTMVIAAQIYGWNDPVNKLQGKSLADDIRSSLYEDLQPPVMRNHLRSAMISAFQLSSSPNWSNTFMANSININLRFNRLEYAKRILATPVPEGAWVHAGIDVDDKFHCSLEQALDPDRPCLVNATVEFGGKDPDISILCAFGAQPTSGQKRPVLRTWMTQTELRWLSKYARIHIVGIETASSVRQLPSKMLLPEILVSDPLFGMSISAGLVAEAHWKGLASSYYKFSAENKREFSLWSIWLRAADRAMSFELALAAHKAGFLVTHYGNGSVGVRTERSRLPELLNFSIDNEVAHPSFRPLFEDNGLIEAF